MTKEINIDKYSDPSQPVISLIADDEAVRLTFGVFLEHMKKRVSDLDKSISQKDWGEVLKSAHKIKGSAGCYGFPQLSDLAQLLETEIQSEDKDPTRIQNAMQDIHLMVLRIELGLKAYS